MLRMTIASPQRMNDLIDAAHSSERDLGAWSSELLDAAGVFLDHGCGFGINVVRLRGAATHEVEIFEGRGVMRDATMSHLYHCFVGEQQDTTLFEAVWQTRRPVMRFSAVAGRLSPVVSEIFKNAGAVDSIGLLASAGVGRYCSLFGYLPAHVNIDARARAVLSQIRPHLETGLRLRCDPSLVPIAVLTDRGKLLHVEADSGLRAFTPQLKAHIAWLEAVRVGREPVEVDYDVWENVCAGRWLLTQCSEANGRNQYVVFESQTKGIDWQRISGSDRKIITYSVNGLSGKEVAAKMKISEAQVSTRLAATARALGLRSRSELLRLVAILRPSRRRSSRYEKLTLAEQEILAMIERGQRNEQIATQRGRSVKTVANQVAAILRKTATTSRRAAVAAR
jgi:DNA-binding NarL/FixJ family response regulator